MDNSQAGSNSTSKPNSSLLKVPIDKDIEMRKQRILLRRSSSSYALVPIKNEQENEEKEKKQKS
jgi:hypothetical protein